MEGWDALNHGTADGLESLKEAVRKYPDDPEAWFLLGAALSAIGTTLWKSLEIRDTEGDYSDASNWRPSSEYSGNSTWYSSRLPGPSSTDSSP